MSKVVIEVSLDAESKALLNAAVAALAGGTAAPAAKAEKPKAAPKAKAEKPKAEAKVEEDEDDFDDVTEGSTDEDEADEDGDEDEADEDGDELTVDNVGEALKAMVAAGAPKAAAVKLLKEQGGVAALSALSPKKFQAVIDAATAATKALKKKAK